MGLAVLLGMLNASSVSSIVDPVMRPIERTARDTSIKGGDTEFFGEGGLGFDDVLDAINPLQQLPGVSTLYRAVSGDGISTIAKLAGGALFGGPIGFFASLAGSVIEMATGNDIGGHMLAMLNGEESEASPSSVQVAGYYDKIAKLG